jgi:hypothetical protein
VKLGEIEAKQGSGRIEKLKKKNEAVTSHCFSRRVAAFLFSRLRRCSTDRSIDRSIVRFPRRFEDDGDRVATLCPIAK